MTVKSILLKFDEKTYNQLLKVKNKKSMTWEDMMLVAGGLYNGSN